MSEHDEATMERVAKALDEHTAILDQTSVYEGECSCGWSSDDCSWEAFTQHQARAALDAMGQVSREEIALVINTYDPLDLNFPTDENWEEWDDALAKADAILTLGVTTPAPRVVESVELRAIVQATFEQANGDDGRQGPMTLSDVLRIMDAALDNLVLTPATAPVVGAEQVEYLTTAIFEQSHEPSFSDDQRGLKEAREFTVNALRAAGIRVESDGA